MIADCRRSVQIQNVGFPRQATRRRCEEANMSRRNRFVASALAVVAAVLVAGAVGAPRDGKHGFSAADFERHVRELRKKLPGEGFTIVVAKPFVVVGDEEPREVRRRAKNTVAWAVEKLKAAYFENDPDEILDVWLFKDKGTNYAQARYLCYYLQQQGLLKKFYRRFRAQRKTDPTGYGTLQEILSRKDMAAFQKEWEAFVLKLRFE
jgi:hypothetical protein